MSVPIKLEDIRAVEIKSATHPLAILMIDRKALPLDKDTRDYLSVMLNMLGREIDKGEAFGKESAGVWELEYPPSLK